MDNKKYKCHISFMLTDFSSSVHTFSEAYIQQGMHEWKHTFFKINKHKQMHQVQGCILSYNTIKLYSYKWKNTHTHTHIYILQTQIPA